MAAKRSAKQVSLRSAGRLRSTADSVFVHDMKNLGFRLGLLLSNVEDHYGDPEFKSSVVDLLQSTLEKVDSVLVRWSAHRKTVLIKVPLGVNEVLRESLREAQARESSLSPSPSRRGRVATDFAELPSIWGDPQYLKNAFLSILQNALEAAGPEGHVTLRTFLGMSGRRSCIVVEVEDDGPGMTAEFVREKLFRPFQTTKAKGVGLGLYTAREIVRAHGGQIRVSSRPRQGTRVIMTFPAPSKAQSQ